MIVSIIKYTRDNSPIFIKKIIAKISNKVFYHNRVYKNTYKELCSRDHLSEEQVKKIQLNKLKEILIHAQEMVPYYKKLFSDIKFNAYNFKDFEEIKKIPYLTKDLIRDNYKDLQSKSTKFCYKATTGGTTGNALMVLQDISTNIKENVFLFRQRERMGLKPCSKILTLRGVQSASSKINYFPHLNEYILSSFDLNSETIENYVAEINKIKPEFLKGYPSSIYFLTCLMKQKNLRFNHEIKAVFFISEFVDSKKRQVIEEFFNTKTQAMYGQTERVVFGDEIKSDTYVFDPYYGYTELEKQVDNKYEIIGTGFINKSMPLIRYKTQDLCSKYNEGYTIVGRRNSNEILYGLNGEEISNASLNFHSQKLKGVLSIQVFQKVNGEIILYLTTDALYSQNIAKQVFDEKLNKIFNYEIVEIKTPILSSRGKFQFILKSKPL
jgi:phenylacetate-CoA ligase